MLGLDKIPWRKFFSWLGRTAVQEGVKEIGKKFQGGTPTRPADPKPPKET